MPIRDLLQEQLRQRGVTVILRFSVATPSEWIIPDMLLKNGAQYDVETNFGSEAKLFDAMTKLAAFLIILYPVLTNETQQPENTHARMGES
jgi:hypothetical protein